jgi:hypothetical protein
MLIRVPLTRGDRVKRTRLIRLTATSLVNGWNIDIKQLWAVAQSGGFQLLPRTHHKELSKVMVVTQTATRFDNITSEILCYPKDIKDALEILKRVHVEEVFNARLSVVHMCQATSVQEPVIDDSIVNYIKENCSNG